MEQMATVFLEDGSISEETFMAWADRYPSQIMLVAMLVDWCDKVEKALTKGGSSEMEHMVDSYLLRCHGR